MVTVAEPSPPRARGQYGSVVHIPSIALQYAIRAAGTDIKKAHRREAMGFVLRPVLSVTG